MQITVQKEKEESKENDEKKQEEVLGSLDIVEAVEEEKTPQEKEAEEAEENEEESDNESSNKETAEIGREEGGMSQIDQNDLADKLLEFQSYESALASARESVKLRQIAFEEAKDVAKTCKKEWEFSRDKLEELIDNHNAVLPLWKLAEKKDTKPEKQQGEGDSTANDLTPKKYPAKIKLLRPCEDFPVGAIVRDVVSILNDDVAIIDGFALHRCDYETLECQPTRESIPVNVVLLIEITDGDTEEVIKSAGDIVSVSCNEQREVSFTPDEENESFGYVLDDNEYNVIEWNDEFDGWEKLEEATTPPLEYHPQETEDSTQESWWKDKKIDEIGLKDSTVKLLQDQKSPIETIGDIQAWQKKYELTALDKIGPAKAKEIEDRLIDFWAANDK